MTTFFYSINATQGNYCTDGCGVEKGMRFPIKEKMAVRVKHWGITCRERERLLEISFGWQSGPALPSQRYLHERLLWLLFQQYPAMLFHGLPAWAGVGRACQHWDFGILSIVSWVWDFVSELHRRAEGSKGGGKDRDVMLDEEKCSSKGLPSFWLVSGCRPLNIIWFSLSLSLSVQLPRSLCCANLQTEGRRSARARASILRTGDRGTEKAR